MKLKHILKNVAAGVFREVVPGGGLIIDTINDALPDGKKLKATATAGEVENALMSLPPEQKASVLEKEHDVTIEEIKAKHESLQQAIKADANLQSTRPYIAKGSFIAYTFFVGVITLYIGVAANKSDEALETIIELWPVFLALYGPYMSVVYAYFGVLRKEHENRLNAFNGKPAGLGALALISRFIKK